MSLDGADIDYYTILEVPRDASDEDIKRGYRKQALRWHPDKNPGKQEEAAERFKLIAEAYEILSDNSRRGIYDKYGRNVVLGRRGGSDQTVATDFSKYQFRTAAELFREFFPDDPFFSEVLEGLESRSRQRQARRNQSFNHYFGDSRSTEGSGNPEGYANQSIDELFRAQFGSSPLYKQFYGDATAASSSKMRDGSPRNNEPPVHRQWTESYQPGYWNLSTSIYRLLGLLGLLAVLLPGVQRCLNYLKTLLPTGSQSAGSGQRSQAEARPADTSSNVDLS